MEVRFGGGESVGGGDGSEGVWDADGAGVVEVSFFRREEAFVGVEGLARERWEGVVGDALGEASEGFEDGGVVKGLAAEDAGFQPVMSLALPLSLDLTVLTRRSGSKMTSAR